MCFYVLIKTIKGQRCRESAQWAVVGLNFVDDGHQSNLFGCTNVDLESIESRVIDVESSSRSRSSCKQNHVDSNDDCANFIDLQLYYYSGCRWLIRHET